MPADNYSTWLAVGMALKDWDSVRGLALWDEWSRTSPKYEAGTCAAKWETFSGANAQGETVTAKTVTYSGTTFLQVTVTYDLTGTSFFNVFPIQSMTRTVQMPMMPQ